MTELKPLNHTGTVRLETERLILRPMSITDADQMYSNWASDTEVSKYMSWEPHVDIAATKSILTKWINEYAKMDYYHWGIELKKTDQIIGSAGTQGINEKHRTADLGYCLGRAYWGKGYMSEAVAAMIRHLFNTVGFNRISASHDVNNIGSGRVMQKCGMVFEGIQRQAHYCPRRGFYDSAYYAILKTDYENNS